MQAGGKPDSGQDDFGYLPIAVARGVGARCLNPCPNIDINDVEFLRRYVSEQGKILPQRLSGLNATNQRKVKRGIRRARTMGLMM